MTTPLALDLALLPTALVGAGPALMKRLALLDAETAPGLRIYAADPEPALAKAAGARLIPRWPTDDEIAALRVLFVAGLPSDQSIALAALGRTHRVLVNVEDVLPLCDFHVPAILRRGDLALSISTGGASPTLARRLRSYLGELFPPEWAERITRIATLRRTMRAGGAGMAEVARATDALIDDEGWLRGLS
jgi:precorrin-2 dehydrogenase/sirohydrochlorin ferrochelatase